MRIAANATMQTPRVTTDHFSVFFAPFHMLGFVSMTVLVCRSEPAPTMARLWVARR
jgi:hypothetical protein